MKTLFLTREFPPYVYGGAGVHVEYLSKELSKLMDVEVRCFGDQNENQGTIQVQGFEYGNEKFIEANALLKPVLQTLNANIEMNIQNIDADVVHCHTWYSNFGGILSKLLYGTPLVVTTHSLEPLRPWKREQLGRGYDTSSWIEKTTIEMADAIIAVSKETKEDVLKHFNVDENKIHMVYNGIDLEEYQESYSNKSLIKHNIDPDLPYVLFVGRITRQKGIIHLVNAIKHLDKDIQVILCAGAPDTQDIAKEMEDLVSEIQKERDHVIWIDEMLPKSEIIELYSHAAVFCCPSIYEPFGIINIEAMACNTAVVASAVGGIKEVVVHGETGLLIPVEQQNTAPFEPINPEKFAKDLADGVNQIIADKELREKMAAKGRQRVEEHFSWSEIAKQIKLIYESIV
jgi:glycogen synthase